jgi:hypothetical protein
MVECSLVRIVLLLHSDTDLLHQAAGVDMATVVGQHKRNAADALRLQGNEAYK